MIEGFVSGLISVALGCAILLAGIFQENEFPAVYHLFLGIVLEVIGIALMWGGIVLEIWG